MKNFILTTSIIIAVLISFNCFGVVTESKFKIHSSLPVYSFKISSGKISVYKGNNSKPFQKIPIDTIDESDPDQEEIGELEVLDINFDGYKDLFRSTYCGMVSCSRDYFLYNKESGKFIYSKEFSDLDIGSGYNRDKRRKILVSTSRSGCCFHKTNTIEVVNGIPVLIRQEVDSQMGEDGITEFYDHYSKIRENNKMVIQNRDTCFYKNKRIYRKKIARENGKSGVILSDSFDPLDEITQAHSKALKAFSKKNYEKAKKILGDAFTVENRLNKLPARLIDENPKNKKLILALNDFGFFLERAGDYENAINILETLVFYTPKRAVAYLNLGDALYKFSKWSKPRCVEKYKKYIELMKAQGKEKKIPKRVYKRLSEFAG